jgi:CheY-like chemotaxis protein
MPFRIRRMICLQAGCLTRLQTGADGRFKPFLTDYFRVDTSKFQRGLKMRILIVDDEPDFVSVVCELLTRAGHDVHGITDGRDTLETMAKDRYDAVILDVVMPRTNGLSMVHHIREQFPEVAVIVVSGIMDVRVAVQAAQAGADACFDKVLGFETIVKYLAERRPVVVVTV